jgi:outer membrane immunogenic protein
VLVFGTGGVAAGRVEVSNAAGSDANTMVGWTAGAGVDVKMTDRVFGRLEYRHTNYGDKTFTLGGTSRNVDVNQNRLMLGVGVQF